jgi:hypothetical protein
MRIIQRILITAWCLFPVAEAFPNAGSLFTEDEFLSATLIAPISRLKKQRKADPDWLPGQLILHDVARGDRSFEVEVKARGHFRRKRGNCSFPPYRLNFKKKEVKGTIFDGLDKVKVVSHCRETRKSFERYIYREYLAYKTLNILTEASFRVRLLNIEYVDSKGRYKTRQYSAFFIEPVEQLAKRLDGILVTERRALPSEFNAEALCLAELFQFLIGNTDFSYFTSEDECCHNSKVIETADGLVPVPYDFDVTGIVDTPYAVVNSRLSIDSVKERYYRGLTTDPAILEKTINRFREKQADILALWQEAPFLSSDDRETAVAYIQSFYEVINDPEQVEAAILDKMRSAKAFENLLLKQMGEQAP